MIALRSTSNTSPNTVTNTVGSEPSGVKPGDVLLAALYIENDIAPTPSGDWTQICDIDHPGQLYDLFVYWARRGASAPSYTWTHSSTWTQLLVSSYTGVFTTGDPQDVTASTNNGTGTTMTGTGITTAHNHALLVLLGAWFANGHTATTTDLTERADVGQIYLADGVKAAAGASGNKTATISVSDDWAATLIALRDANPAIVNADYRDYPRQSMRY